MLSKEDRLALHVGNQVAHAWDDITLDSDIGIPADAFSFDLFYTPTDVLPQTVKEGSQCEVFVGDERVMIGIIDKINRTADASGMTISLSGRDLAGQLLDCAAPVKHEQNMTLEAILQRYVFAGDLGGLPWNITLPETNWLKEKTGVEPSETVWDVIAKAAQSSGQYVWMDADGTLRIGNPFNVKQPSKKHTLRLNRNDNSNNVLTASYAADISSAYTVVDVKGQTITGANYTGTASDNRIPLIRRQILSDSRADTQPEAVAFAEKTLRDSWLEARTLTVLVSGHKHAGEVWKTGWRVSFESNIMPVAKGDWVIYGRTLMLSNSAGRTTELRLKRLEDWMQPIAYADLIDPPERRQRRRRSRNRKRIKVNNET